MRGSIVYPEPAKEPATGPFPGVDPLATSSGQDMFSPYAAMGNAPESMVDPNGTSPGPGSYSFSPGIDVVNDMGATEAVAHKGWNKTGGVLVDFGEAEVPEIM